MIEIIVTVVDVVVVVVCVCVCVEASDVDRTSCVLALVRCLDTAVCYASLHRVKTDCVWNDTA